MNRTDTIKILAVLRAAFPNFYKGMGKSELEPIVGLWQDAFAEDDVGLVGSAVKAIIYAEAREFPPNIGQVKEKMRQLVNPDEMGDAEAWALIRKAVANGYYGYAEEYAKLPPMLQKLIGSANQLREWSVMDTDTFNSVVASNFRKWFTTAQAREQEQAKLPASVKAVLSATAERMRLEA